LKVCDEDEDGKTDDGGEILLKSMKYYSRILLNISRAGCASGSGEKSIVNSNLNVRKEDFHPRS
jgi:hypothetical protein